MLIKEIMTKNPITIDENSSIFEAAEIYKKNNIGCLLILKDSKCIGIITERDIIERTICEKKDIEKTKVKDIMSTDVFTIHDLEKVEKAIEIMSKYNIKKLPVLHDNILVGIITATDISRARPDLSTRFMDSWVKPDWDD